MLRITEAFNCLKSPDGTPKGSLVKLCLSDHLEQWRREQHALGRILPSKGHGLGSVSKEALALLGAQTWPEPLVQNNTLFISGMANMLIGASDAEALYTNYCLDVAFFYEHSYHKAFPGFEDLVEAFLGARDQEDGVLAELWWSLATGPMRYVAQGVVGPAEEEDLAERLRLSMARSYSRGTCG